VYAAPVQQSQIVTRPLLPVFMPMFDPMFFGDPMPARRNSGRQVLRVNATKAESAKASQLLTIGDRLFRAGNIKRAADRYEQSLRVDPTTASAHIRLAQVALVRGQYSVAADEFREATATEPDWIARARDVQALFSEPAEFRGHIAKLESHLLKEPNDRDGWLVLGAELFLSGQTRRAGDVFVRLTDRKPDPALAAFLEASGSLDEAAR
jgi:cytochrome c-type biogenesis protein CcmH/NrfG